MPPWNGGCDSGPREVHASRLIEDADPPLGPKVVHVIRYDDSASPSRCYESQQPLLIGVVLASERYESARTPPGDGSHSTFTGRLAPDQDIRSSLTMY